MADIPNFKDFADKLDRVIKDLKSNPEFKIWMYRNPDRFGLFLGFCTGLFSVGVPEEEWIDRAAYQLPLIFNLTSLKKYVNEKTQGN